MRSDFSASYGTDTLPLRAVEQVAGANDYGVMRLFSRARKRVGTKRLCGILNAKNLGHQIGTIQENLSMNSLKLSNTNGILVR